MSKIQYISKDSKKSYKIINNKKIAVYIRVSTEHENQKESLVNQKKLFDRLLGVDEYDMYCDEGLSAAIKLENRLAFKNMLEQCGLETSEAHSKEDKLRELNQEPTKNKGTLTVAINSKKPKYNFIYVKSTSRFARSYDGATILTLLKEKNVGVKVTSNGLNSLVDSDWKHFLAALYTDTVFSKSLSESVKSGFIEKHQSGMLTNVRYYGAKPVLNKKTVEKYEIIENEAEAVRLIYEWYLNGIIDENGNLLSQPLGFKTIAIELNKRGYPTLLGKPWNQGTVQKIMGNEKYKGYFNGGKYDASRIDNPGRNSSKIRDKYECYPHEGIPAIVTPELWDACAEKRLNKESAINRIESTNQSTRYGGLVYCGLCGSKYKHNKTIRNKKILQLVKKVDNAVNELVKNEELAIPKDSIFYQNDKILKLVLLKNSDNINELSPSDKNRLDKIIKELKKTKTNDFDTFIKNNNIKTELDLRDSNMVGYYVCKVKKDQSSAKCNNHNVMDEQLDEMIEEMCNGGYAALIKSEFIYNVQLCVSKIGVEFSNLIDDNKDIDKITSLKNELNAKESEINEKINLYGKLGGDNLYLENAIDLLNKDIRNLKVELTQLQRTPNTSINIISKKLQLIEDLLKEFTQLKTNYTQWEIFQKIARIVVYPDNNYLKPNRYSKPKLHIIYKNQLASEDDLGFTPLGNVVDNNSNDYDIDLTNDDNDFKDTPYLESFKNKNKWSGKVAEEDGLIIEMGTITGKTIQQQIQEYLDRQKLKLEKFKEVL